MAGDGERSVGSQFIVSKGWDCAVCRVDVNCAVRARITWVRRKSAGCERGSMGGIASKMLAWQVQHRDESWWLSALWCMSSMQVARAPS
jgi:hypothetical protein